MTSGQAGLIVALLFVIVGLLAIIVIGAAVTWQLWRNEVEDREAHRRSIEVLAAQASELTRRAGL